MKVYVRRVSGDVTKYHSMVGLRVEVGTSNVSNTKQDCDVWLCSYNNVLQVFQVLLKG